MKGTLALVALLTSAAACDGGQEPLFGPPTESVCPDTQSLTYENFGKPFVESYCTQCHHSELHGEERMGAPTFHDFDTVFGIRAVSEHIDWTAAYGPAAQNDTMPPDDQDQPTAEEREKLGEWIACEMPTDQDLAGQ